MNLLLDTCAFLYWVSGSPKLSARAREAIENTANRIFFSAASAMEIATTGMPIVSDDSLFGSYPVTVLWK